jgi:hypothetical protein
MFAATYASGNHIGAEGATALASALERNSTLKHLCIGGECRLYGTVLVMRICVRSVIVCQMRWDFWYSVMRALGNFIGTLGAMALASALVRNRMLQHLDVSGKCVMLECAFISHTHTPLIACHRMQSAYPAR